MPPQSKSLSTYFQFFLTRDKCMLHTLSFGLEWNQISKDIWMWQEIGCFMPFFFFGLLGKLPIIKGADSC